MPLPTLPTDDTVVSPAIWGVLGMLVTKGIDYLANRSRNASDENLRRDARQALLDERKNRAEREDSLLREIHNLVRELNEAKDELQAARKETVKLLRANVKLEGKITRLELALESAGIVVDHSEVEDE